MSAVRAAEWYALYRHLIIITAILWVAVMGSGLAIYTMRVAGRWIASERERRENE